MKKYEYKVIAGDTQPLTEFLLQYGLEGWELCCWERYINGSTFIFKREIINLNK